MSNEQLDDATEGGIVYVLSNRAMPQYIKIGSTQGNSPEDVLKRMKELDNTSVPLPFDCEYAAVVPDYKRVERNIHTAFEDRRVRNREFFQEVAPHRVKAVLKLVEIADATPREEATPAVEEPRAPKFRFSLVNIPNGATLHWADNNQETCIVDNDTHILYKDQRTTISAAAKELKGWSAAQGSLYWMYKDKTLQEWRELVEAGDAGPPTS